MDAVRGAALLLCAVALPLTGCGGPGAAERPAAPSGSASAKKSAVPKAHTLVFSVEGKGHVRSIAYTVDGKKTTVRSVDIPWKKTVHVPARAGGHAWDLSIHHGNGTFNYAVYVDGRSYGTSGCGGSNCGGGSSGSMKN